MIRQLVMVIYPYAVYSNRMLTRPSPILQNTERARPALGASGLLVSRGRKASTREA